MRGEGGGSCRCAGIVARPGFALVGMMAYEAQIAGVTNKGKPIVQAMQRTSAPEPAERRGAAVAGVPGIARPGVRHGRAPGVPSGSRATP